MTQPIDNFIVKLKDGTVIKVEVGEGDGYFREELFVGKEKSFTTFQCFVASGTSRIIPSGKA